jgi:hypothetical protein
LKVTWGFPSDLGVVPSRDGFRPVPAVGLSEARTGGHALAQAPEQLLVVPVSAWNRYSVRPDASTMIWPRPLALATSTVAPRPLAEAGGAVEVAVVLAPAE